MTSADRARLVKLLGLLGSDQDGERAAAAKAADDLVKRHGLSWESVVKLCAPIHDPMVMPDHHVKTYEGVLRRATRQNDDFAAEYVRQAEAARAQQANAQSWHQGHQSYQCNQQSAESRRPSIFEFIFGKGIL